VLEISPSQIRHLNGEGSTLFAGKLSFTSDKNSNLENYFFQLTKTFKNDKLNETEIIL